MEIDCRFYCRYINGKAFTKYVIQNHLGELIRKYSLEYFAKNELEGYIKTISQMICKIESSKSKIEYSSITFNISNHELILILTASRSGENLGIDIQQMLKEILNFIKSKNVAIKLIEENNKYKLIYNQYKYLNEDYELLYQYQEELFAIITGLLTKDYFHGISQLEILVQDILHFIENIDLENEKKIEYVDSIKKIRLTRRNLKNDMELRDQLRPLLCYFESVLRIQMYSHIDNILPNNLIIENDILSFSSKDFRDKILNSL